MRTLSSLLLTTLVLVSGCVAGADAEEGGTIDEALAPDADDAERDAEFAAQLDGKADAALTHVAVAKLAKAAGVSCSGDRLALAVAIAQAESGLRPKAFLVNKTRSGTYNGTDRGLWQINSKYHPNVSDECAYSPSCNARAMARISVNGTKWTPWWTFKNGKHRPFMSDARAAAAAVCP